MASRYLPESEIDTRRNELLAEIRSYRRKLRDSKLELAVLERFSTKLIEVEPARNMDVRARPSIAADTSATRAPSPASADEDEESGPTDVILRLLSERPGLDRDEIYDTVEDQFSSKSTNKRNVVLSTLRRLVTKYKRLDEVNGRYYLKGTAPSAAKPVLSPYVTATRGPRMYDDFQAPPFEDDDDDFRMPPFEDDDSPDPDLRV